VGGRACAGRRTRGLRATQTGILPRADPRRQRAWATGERTPSGMRRARAARQRRPGAAGQRRQNPSRRTRSSERSGHPRAAAQSGSGLPPRRQRSNNTISRPWSWLHATGPALGGCGQALVATARPATRIRTNNVVISSDSCDRAALDHRWQPGWGGTARMNSSRGDTGRQQYFLCDKDADEGLKSFLWTCSHFPAAARHLQDRAPRPCNRRRRSAFVRGLRHAVPCLRWHCCCRVSKHPGCSSAMYIKEHQTHSPLALPPPPPLQ
jgi:hypothetical protein